MEYLQAPESMLEAIDMSMQTLHIVDEFASTTTHGARTSTMLALMTLWLAVDSSKLAMVNRWSKQSIGGAYKSMHRVSV